MLGGGLALLFALVVAITLLFEPNFAASIAGEARSPWVVREWLRTLRRLVESSPDLLLIPAIGLWLWTGRGAETRDVRWAVLATVLLGSSLVMSAKYGADLNYFLSLRIPESLAIGTLWHAGRHGEGMAPVGVLSAAAALAIVALVPGAFHAASQALLARIRPHSWPGRRASPSSAPTRGASAWHATRIIISSPTRACSTSTRASGPRSATPGSSGRSSTRARSSPP